MGATENPPLAVDGLAVHRFRFVVLLQTIVRRGDVVHLFERPRMIRPETRRCNAAARVASGSD